MARITVQHKRLQQKKKKPCMAKNFQFSCIKTRRKCKYLHGRTKTRTSRIRDYGNSKPKTLHGKDHGLSQRLDQKKKPCMARQFLISCISPVLCMARDFRLSDYTPQQIKKPCIARAFLLSSTAQKWSNEYLHRRTKSRTSGSKVK